MDEMVRYYYFFTGRVQSVGFRYKASLLAQAYKLTGFVKNEYDGSVSLEVQGPEETIDQFVEELRTDRVIRIYSMSKERLDLVEGEKGFKVEF
ncbi:acylphosphatase [Lachnospira sp.]|jgi:acylphosphatase|uniref:acylphosphatase n=1 Tax=Lachnospira sp. TaxID=2049031 RepID=UPI00257E674E|nr:acylphosphatase [Lachnospira sp.]